MSFRKKREDYIRTQYNKIKTFILTLRKLSKYDQLPSYDQNFIRLVAILSVVFLFIGIVILYCWALPPLQVDKHYEIGRIDVPPNNEIHINNIKVDYSSHSAISVNQPIEIEIEGSFIVNELNFNPPESFTIEFRPNRAITLDDEDPAVICINASYTDSFDLKPQYKFNGMGEAKFKTSGKNALTIEFLYPADQKIKGGVINDVFEIDPAYITLQVSQLKISKYVAALSLVTLYLASVSVSNMIRGIYRDRSNMVREIHRERTKLRREIYRDRNRPR
ncbi:hypothetical protein ACFLY8_01025 [Halobacteriota archaeon]